MWRIREESASSLPTRVREILTRRRRGSIPRESRHAPEYAGRASRGPADKPLQPASAGIIPAEAAEPAAHERWFSDDHGIREDVAIATALGAFIVQHREKTVVMSDRIIGCPHEEGIDYPQGQTCPVCPFWATRDRWTGDSVH